MTQVDRRKFLQQAGVVSATTGALWVAPAVLGSSAAFAVGSGVTGTTVGTTIPVDLGPCGNFDWGTATKAVVTSPLTSTLPGITMTTTHAFVGTTPPTVGNHSIPFNPALVDRNFQINVRPYSGEGSISGNTTDQGIVLVQSNTAGASGYSNYQSVTFTFSQPLSNVQLMISDLTAHGLEGTTDGYMDAVGFDAPAFVVNDTSSHRTGTGTFADPFRRLLATDYFHGLSPVYAPYNVPLDLTVGFVGPLTSLTLRYSSLAGPDLQWIKIGDVRFGGC